MQRLKRWLPTVRVVASMVMLVVLVQRVHLTSILPDTSRHTMGWLVAAVVVWCVGVVLSAVRWQRVLYALDIHMPLRALVGHYLASLFVSNFLPSTVGGDVLRVTRLSSANGDTPRNFASVVLERLTGWVVLPVLTLTALLVNPGLRHLGRASWLAFLIAVITLVLLVGVLVAAGHPAIGGRLTSTEGWRRFTGAIHLGLEQFRRRPALAIEVLTTSFAYQLVVMLAAFLAADALGLGISWTAILAFMPAVAIVQVLPITIGGLGVREGALVLFLRPLGVSTQHAIALGLLVYGINLAVSLLGAPAFAVGSSRRATRVPA
ncbi:MAG TPA: lysylphosphatidylglycerol synthase transmembrane domain-containing protein [Acidimicrobiales bacterium]|nr:lysylphosphatidylglycerol synthase transmembrane domain-containing protein [Acidimicrobiales bacterium]